ncbi:penicillin acylase family protein [Amycolatopsis sp. WQ 127309]|uniref:penicillin acylase family protein n=1 Tax=Amycolatopsis sp. WQ 127309 TaxID=2932773 RepID=UPI001FF199C2|nr:penicillin acylase family protein [Amycolatopsis sp. WQ 127309]UOZ09058.1 penicillin acylase family protein [Amycolatopsis sp. WQ 127309]
MRRGIRTLTLTALAGLVAGLTQVAVTAPAAEAAAAPNDYCGGQCSDILPPGENGNATLADILAHKVLGTRPAHAADQLGKYSSLAGGYQTLTTGTINQYFNDSSFGVAADQVASTTQPRSDVTIVRDKALGVPHITGTTRAGTEFGAGYAAGQDRLWLMDVLRHAARGQVTSFAGGAAANRELEQSFFANAPYTEAELQQQIDNVAAKGPRGAQGLADAQAYVDGINKYIADSHSGRYFPGEYVLTGHVDAITNAGTIDPFKLTDLVALASLVGAEFGAGGGGEVQNAVAKLALQEQYGAVQGEKVWQSLRSEDDPEAVKTLHDGQTFPYGKTPANAVGQALPDKGSVTPQQLVFDQTGSASTATPSTVDVPAPAAQEPARGMFDNGVLPGDMLTDKHGMSNALVVSGSKTASGHPVAVFGPQTGYFAPQLLMLQELQGPGISARGAAFAGLSMYVLLGRGQDYSWSATTSAQDIIDTYALNLCDPSGKAPTKDSNYYTYKGQCLPMETVEVKNSWNPTVADGTAAGSYTLRSYRTKYGPVLSRATVGGKPVAYAQLRSSLFHEADSLIGFQELNDPGYVKSAADFQKAAADINFTFNWFYADSKDVAYFNSGANPARQSNVDPNMPVWGDQGHDWTGWNPAGNVATYTPASQHPQSVNQDYYVSWNNAQANGYAAAGADKSAVHRADLLDTRVKTMILTGTKVTRVNLTQAMEDAALADLRAERVLPLLLQVLDKTPTTGAAADAEAKLKTWMANGHQRTETTAGSKAYADADAIRIFDAWWPLLVQAEFKPGMGDNAYNAMTGVLGINESPSGFQNGNGQHTGQPHKGSSFQFGWWGYVSKDIRQVLGQPVAGPLGSTFCGGGNVTTCRQALVDSLTSAAGQAANTVYPGDASCAAGDQWCADTIVHNALGGITQDKISWQNRPTFQQVVEYTAHRGDNIANLAPGKTVSATSAETGFYPSPASNAIDGNASTRWASDWSDDQAITVDLGSVQPVSRVQLRWESAYGKGYKIQTSPDAVHWTDSAVVTNGDGGQDNVSFAPTQARFVKLQGVQRGTKYGYSLYEFEVYAH